MSKTGEEFVCSGAFCRCDKGLLPMPLTVMANQTVKLQGRLVATTLDKVFPPFGTCAVKNNTPCVPALLVWQDYFDTVGIAVPGAYPLLEKSTIKCALGGTVSIVQTMQLSIPGLPAPPQVEGLRTSSMSLCPLLLHGKDGEAEEEAAEDAAASNNTAAALAVANASSTSAPPPAYAPASAKPRGMPLSDAEVAAQYGPHGTAVVAQTKAEALRIGQTQSSNQRGPVLTGVRDPLTGQTHFGQNTDQIPTDLHPVLKNRLAAYQNALATGSIEADPQDIARAGRPGTHSEIVALHQALIAREAATKQAATEEALGEFLLHNRSLVAKSLGEGVPPRCVNCWHITQGARVIGND